MRRRWRISRFFSRDTSIALPVRQRASRYEGDGHNQARTKGSPAQWMAGGDNFSLLAEHQRAKAAAGFSGNGPSFQRGP